MEAAFSQQNIIFMQKQQITNHTPPIATYTHSWVTTFLFTTLFILPCQDLPLISFQNKKAAST